MTLRELSIIRNKVSSLLHDFNADCYQAMDNNIHLESDVEVSNYLLSSFLSFAGVYVDDDVDNKLINVYIIRMLNIQ